MEPSVFPQKASEKNHIRFSINKKILILSAAIVLPFLIFVAVLLVSMTRYNRRFDKIVSNMTVANNYNLNFKEEMDESLYKLVVGYVDYEEISENGSLKDPYALIGELRGEFTTLRDITTEAESRLWLESLLRNIDTLEKRVDDIMENIRIGGRYDENIEELDNNIYILTELIQDNIQYYIYYQTKSMEAVTTDLNRQIHNFVIACGLLGMVLLVLTVLVTYLITADILRPIKVLYDATQRVSQGDLSARADVASRDEIEILARGFNDMAGNLELLVQRTKEDEQKLRKLDLRLLQEQINPPFPVQYAGHHCLAHRGQQGRRGREHGGDAVQLFPPGAQPGKGAYFPEGGGTAHQELPGNPGDALPRHTGVRHPDRSGAVRLPDSEADAAAPGGERALPRHQVQAG